jgi:hypothetical protein
MKYNWNLKFLDFVKINGFHFREILITKPSLLKEKILILIYDH